MNPSSGLFVDLEQRERERGYHGSTSCASNIDVGNDGPSLFSSLVVRAVASKTS